MPHESWATASTVPARLRRTPPLCAPYLPLSALCLLQAGGGGGGGGGLETAESILAKLQAYLDEVAGPEEAVQAKLEEGWKVEIKVRSAGNSAGSEGLGSVCVCVCVCACVCVWGGQ